MTRRLEGAYFDTWARRIDLIIASVLTIGFFLFVNHFWCTLSTLLDKDGTTLYGAFLSALAALLGFAVASIAIVASLVVTEPFDDLRKGPQFNAFWLAFIWSIQTLATATLISAACLVINSFASWRESILTFCFWAIALAAVSLIRSGIALEAVLAQVRFFERKPTVTQRSYKEAPED